jgi:hypothetical protein
VIDPLRVASLAPASESQMTIADRTANNEMRALFMTGFPYCQAFQRVALGAGAGMVFR